MSEPGSAARNTQGQEMPEKILLRAIQSASEAPSAAMFEERTREAVMAFHQELAAHNRGPSWQAYFREIDAHPMRAPGVLGVIERLLRSPVFLLFMGVYLIGLGLYVIHSMLPPYIIYPVLGGALIGVGARMLSDLQLMRSERAALVKRRRDAEVQGLYDRLERIRIGEPPQRYNGPPA
ncbi:MULTISPECIES: hypothetical protein [unclassified Bosea (in: a-proteobacteria)]|uniref:hypothetical protein n=1 Tax=unclassified Bosea (in: a-proteobacteria) TaxID=2653178 RepID=UPI000F7603BE|nr:MULTISPECIES: hypothetical protein [unclassified Bosea (in: a-proteobacteria)]AZO77716.1 hypothetical protein BLM15_08875 [Bosea sp. Tri-49]RXT18329.1 hypothetical protein B5U98_24030 [Bosea sp. Tri-39]RXT32925.1 hypothetical protein B5U99_30375 [Bosea sp. Tri-54]